MPVETFGYLDSLEPTNPVINDALVNGDDHIRGIKSVLKATFPGLTGAASRIISGSWGFLAGPGAAETPSYSFAAEPTLGLYRPSAGLLGFLGRLVGNGAVPVGSLHQFLVAPEGFKNDGSAGAQYLELNGQTYQTADYPRLASHLGVTASTFTLINVTDTGRFLRSRTSTLVAGTKQSNAFKTHSVTATGTTDAQGYHAHSVSGSTGFMDRNDPHSHQFVAYQPVGPLTINNGLGSATAVASNTDYSSINHAHVVSGSTDGQGNHAHNVSVTGTATGDTETRPEALSVIMCIKT